MTFFVAPTPEARIKLTGSRFISLTVIAAWHYSTTDNSVVHTLKSAGRSLLHGTKCQLNSAHEPLQAGPLGRSPHRQARPGARRLVRPEEGDVILPCFADKVAGSGGANLTLAPASISVMPAKAGTQGRQHRARRTWTPACTGATSKRRRESSDWFVPLDDSKGVDAGGFLVPVYRKRIPGSAETIPDCGDENSRLARPRELSRKHLIGKAVFEAFDGDIGRNPEYFPANREFAVPAASGG
jgi:hypothetical protein